MKNRKGRILGLAALLLALAALYSGWIAWGRLPVESVRLPMFVVNDGNRTQYLILAEITYPTIVRAGWQAAVTVRVTAEPADALLADQAPVMIVPIETGQPWPAMEGRLELPGTLVSPPGLSLRRLEPDREALIHWDITPARRGELRGTIWLYLQDDRSETGRQAVLAKPLELPCRSALLSPRGARLTAIALAVLAALMGFLAGRQQRRPA